MNKKQTRKEFLTNTSKYAVGAVVGVAGLNAVTNNKLFGGTADVVWPLPYVTIGMRKIAVRVFLVHLRSC
jgi:hypothetical protein